MPIKTQLKTNRLKSIVLRTGKEISYKEIHNELRCEFSKRIVTLALKRLVNSNDISQKRINKEMYYMPYNGTPVKKRNKHNIYNNNTQVLSAIDFTKGDYVAFVTN